MDAYDTFSGAPFYFPGGKGADLNFSTFQLTFPRLSS